MTERPEFDIVPFGEHPTAQAQVRALSLCALMGCIPVGIAYFAGALSGNGALFFLIAGAGALAFFIWRFWSEYRGSARIDAEHLVLDTGSGRDDYKWSDVRDIRLVSFAELGRLSLLTARLAGVDVHRRFVEITLTRRPRVSITNRMSTDVRLGVPRLSKRLYLYLTRPEEFVSEAKALSERDLRASDSA